VRRSGHNGRTDANHSEILNGLTARGIVVRDTHSLGDGFPDAIAKGIKKRYGEIVLLEIKDPAKSPSKRALTDDEKRFHGNWRGVPLFVVETIEQAMAAVSGEGIDWTEVMGGDKGSRDDR
jgi:hypothetical protein